MMPALTSGFAIIQKEITTMAQVGEREMSNKIYALLSPIFFPKFFVQST